MLKKAVQQGRSKRRAEEVHTALRVGRSPLQWVLANGKTPSATPIFRPALPKVEPLSEARTKLADFFSILLAARGIKRMTFIKPLAMILGVGLGILTASASAIAQEMDTKKPLSVSSKAAPGAADKALLTVTPDYIIGPEDILEITVWKNADLSKQVQVRPDGRISLPLLGDISAVAKTPVQLTEEISAGLRAYMENPTISIMVKEVNSYQIYVLGEVNKPGKYPLKSKTTLLQGITVAGGFTAMAARNKIVIFRFSKDGEGLTKLKASYDDIVVRDGSTQNMELKPGDQIVVPSETMVVLPSR